MKDRFRGFLPVVVDVETGGFDARTDALLEVAATILHVDADGRLAPQQTLWHHVQPFSGANIEEASLKVNGIKPHNPLRLASPEKDVLDDVFKHVRAAIRAQQCTRAILVGHNAHFDLGFINAAVERCKIKRSPFHPFSVFDTVTLAGVVVGQTVLARAAQAAHMDWEASEAHSARYDTERTAELFCLLYNRIHNLLDTPAPTA